MRLSFFAADTTGIAKSAVSPPHAVIQLERTVSSQRLASSVFVFHDARNNGFRVIADDIFFGLAQGRLVGNLIEIPNDLRSFAEESAHGES